MFGVRDLGLHHPQAILTVTTANQPLIQQPACLVCLMQEISSKTWYNKVHQWEQRPSMYRVRPRNWNKNNAKLKNSIGLVLQHILRISMLWKCGVILNETFWKPCAGLWRWWHPFSRGPLGVAFGTWFRYQITAIHPFLIVTGLAQYCDLC